MISEISCDYCGAANSTAASFCHTCGRPIKPKPAPGSMHITRAPGSVLLNQRYRQLHKLGTGGQGEVYQVEDTKLANRLLAAKKLQPSNIRSVQERQEAIDAFQREATMLANLKHPNLPEIYDYFEENNDYYLIMELISGETLDNRLEKAGQQLLPIDEVLRIGIELATVLDYLHTRTPPIIFRDLKPDNMMLTPAGQIYLIDFGIARHFKPGQKKDTIRMGRPGYTSPELLFGIEQTNTVSDIYSLGAVLYELITGDVPQYKNPIRPNLPGQAPGELSRLIMNMLAFDQKDRLASMALIKQKLQSIVSKLQQSTAPSNPQTRPTAPSINKTNSATSNKTKILQQIAPASPPTPAVSNHPPLPKKRGELHYTYAHTSQTVWALAWSPDSLHLAIAGEEPDSVHIWQALTGKTVQTYKAHKRPIHALAWSPDSRYLASASNDRTVRIWEALTGLEQYIYLEHTHWVQTLAWSPSGTLLASGDARGSIHVWGAQTGHQHMIYQNHQAQILALAFSPDGTLIASTDDSNQHMIQVWETVSGKLQTTYTGHKDTINALAWSPDGKQIVSGSWERTDHALHIWEASTGQQTATYLHHQRMVNAVSWSPTTHLIASASKDKTVHIWHPHTGQTQFIYRGHTSGVNVLTWSPSGVYLASASDDATVHVWRAN